MFITAKWIGKGERINEFDGKTVEITQTDQQRLFLLGLSTLKKMHRTSETYETITDVMSVLLKFQKKKRKREAEKTFEEIMAVISQSGKTHKPIDS